MEKFKFWPIFWKFLFILWFAIPTYFFFEVAYDDGNDIWISIQTAALSLLSWAVFSGIIWGVYKIAQLIQRSSEKAHRAESTEESLNAQKEQLENEALGQEVKNQKLVVTNKLMSLISKIFR